MFHRIPHRAVAFLTTLALAASITAASVSTASAANSLPLPLTNYHSGLCLGVSGMSKANGASAIQWTCNNADSQAWSWEATSNGYYVAVNLNSGKCLDVAAASVTAGSWAIQYTCDRDEGEQWYAELIKTIGVTDLYYLVNRNSGLCLDVKGQSVKPGTQVIQWYCNQGTNQQWFVSAPGV